MGVGFFLSLISWDLLVAIAFWGSIGFNMPDSINFYILG